MGLKNQVLPLADYVNLDKIFNYNEFVPSFKNRDSDNISQYE